MVNGRIPRQVMEDHLERPQRFQSEQHSSRGNF